MVGGLRTGGLRTGGFRAGGLRTGGFRKQNSGQEDSGQADRNVTFLHPYFIDKNETALKDLILLTTKPLSWTVKT